MCQTCKYAVELKQLFNEISDEYNRLYLEIGKCDLKQQDLLHEIENCNFNASQGYRLAKELKEIREKRREVKNDFTIIEMIKKDFVNRYNQQLSKVLDSVMQKNNKLDQLTEDKVYINRINDDGEIVKSSSKRLLNMQKEVKKQARSVDSSNLPI